jgi:hypothetical protein
MFASVWHFPDRMSRIFARYVSLECLAREVTHFPIYQHAHKGVVAASKLLFANELILRDVIPIGNV